MSPSRAPDLGSPWGGGHVVPLARPLQPPLAMPAGHGPPPLVSSPSGEFVGAITDSLCGVFLSMHRGPGPPSLPRRSRFWPLDARGTARGRGPCPLQLCRTHTIGPWLRGPPKASRGRAVWRQQRQIRIQRLVAMNASSAAGPALEAQTSRRRFP